MNILFFGDSITYGEHDEQGGGYVDILKRYCHERYPSNISNEVNCFNLGIGGETTEGALKRFETEINARYSENKTIIFIAYGANDLAQKEGKYLVDINRFESNYSELIRFAKKYSSKIYLLNILPIAASVDGVVVPNRKFRNTKTIEAYNQILIKIAFECNLDLIDINSKFEPFKEEFLSNDGVHPNAKGYQFISDILKPLLNIYLKE